MHTTLNAKNASGKKTLPIKWRDQTWSPRIVIRSIAARTSCREARFLARSARGLACEARTGARFRGARVSSALALPVHLLNSRFSNLSSSDNSL